MPLYVNRREALTLAACCAGTSMATALQRPPATPLKIGFVHIGPVADGGWSQSHDQGRAAIELKFGAGVRTTTVESVPDGPDAERVFRDLVAQGHALIFGTSFGYGASILKVATENPEVRFEHATGLRTSANVRVFDSRDYEASYLAGVVAADASKTRRLGAVGSMPIPSVVRTINAFALGAMSVDPEIKVKVVWTNDWFNPPKEGEAAQALFNAGADVLLQTGDSSAVMRVAERSGKHAFGLHTDMQSVGPNAHLGSIVTDWGPYYVKSVQQAINGSWTTGQVWWGAAESTVDLVSVPNTIPMATKRRLDAVRKGLRGRDFEIWRGPLTDNNGKLILAAGQMANDSLLRGMLAFVKGVEGKLPGRSPS